MPVVAVVVAVQVIRRMGTYAISAPPGSAVLPRWTGETRFKAKPVIIDIVIYRGGDMLNAWAFTALTQGLGLGLAAVGFEVGAGGGGTVGNHRVYLGRQFNAMKRTNAGNFGRRS